MYSKSTLLLLGLLCVFSCDKEVPKTIISGILPNQPNSKISLLPSSEFFPGLESIKSYPETTTDSLGNFKFTLDSLSSDFYKITSATFDRVKQDLYVLPGDSIHIAVPRYRSDQQFLISGKGSKKLQYLVEDHNIFPKSPEFFTKIRGNDFKTELEFKHYIDSIYQLRLEGMETMYFENEAIKNNHLQTLNYERAEYLLSHLEYRNYRMNDFFGYFHPADAYYDFLQELNFPATIGQNTAAKRMAKHFLTNKVETRLNEIEADKKWQLKFGERFRYATNQSPTAWNDLLLLSIVNEYSMAMLQDNFFETLKTYKEDVAQHFSSNNLKALYDLNIEVFANLAPGKPAPDFELPDAQGRLHRLSDLKGKAVYIDFWGTWCGPCIQEIPAALELQEAYAKEPIVFLYVALEYAEEDIERWKQFIAGKTKRSQSLFDGNTFPGMHLVADKQFNNEALKPYSLNFAPTHVLIDQEGRLVDARANGAAYIKEDLDKLLKTDTSLSVEAP
jgi:thiol-disulfide isomerase/thioredoxin